jgi:hypothetical protein
MYVACFATKGIMLLGTKNNEYYIFAKGKGE